MFRSDFFGGMMSWLRMRWRKLQMKTGLNPQYYYGFLMLIGAVLFLMFMFFKGLDQSFR